MSGIRLHDFNCGLKAYRLNVVKSVEVYGDMHRYIPVLAKGNGFTSIGEKVVQHQERKYGVTKFGMDRFVKGFLDLLTVSFLTRFGKKPMHLFGFMGSLMFMVGLGIALYMGIDKLIALIKHIPQRLIADSAFFYIGLTSMIIGNIAIYRGISGGIGFPECGGKEQLRDREGDLIEIKQERKMKIHLISGACGFVGRNMVKRVYRTTDDMLFMVDDLSIGTHPSTWMEYSDRRR